MATIVRSNLEQLEAWQELYRDQLGLRTDFPVLRDHWKHQEDFLGIPILGGYGLAGLAKLVVVPQGVTTIDLCQACTRQFACYLSRGVDLRAIRSDFAAVSRDLACWIYPAIDAPAKLSNLSADDLVKTGASTLLLDGRLAYGLDFWSNSREHLDQRTATLLPGSRDVYDNVVGVYLRDGKMWIDLWPRSAKGPSVRARSAAYL